MTAGENRAGLAAAAARVEAGERPPVVIVRLPPERGTGHIEVTFRPEWPTTVALFDQVLVAGRDIHGTYTDGDEAADLDCSFGERPLTERQQRLGTDMCRRALTRARRVLAATVRKGAA